MSVEERRVFPLETALMVVANKKGNEVTDFVSYAAQREICDLALPAVRPVVRGWLFSLQPDFMKAANAPEQGYDAWVAEHKKNIGDNISLEPMSDIERAALAALLDDIEGIKENLDAKTAELEELTAKFEEAEPFVAKFEKMEAEKTALEEKNAELGKEVAELKKTTAQFKGKIPIDGDSIEQSVKDMVAKAVKEALANLPVGVAGAAPADGAAPAVEEESGPAPEFGFGATSSDGDGFGF